MTKFTLATLLIMLKILVMLFTFKEDNITGYF